MIRHVDAVVAEVLQRSDSDREALLEQLQRSLPPLPEVAPCDVEQGKTRLDVIQLRAFCEVVGQSWLHLLKRFESEVASGKAESRERSRTFAKLGQR